MGQYRQWLHYREIDQQLKGQLATLEQELITTRAQAQEDDSSYAENPIIQALVSQHAAKLLTAVEQRLAASLPPQTFTEPATEPIPSTTALQLDMQPIARQEQGAMSAALLAWGGLPNLTSHDMQEPIINATTQSSLLPSTDLQEQLLPQDVSSFVAAHSLTDPQIKMPWWIRDIARRSSNGAQSKSPVDQQSQRTNRLVQRWFERWGEQARNPEETQHGKNRGQHGHK